MRTPMYLKLLNFHIGPVDLKWGIVLLLPLSEVHSQHLGFTDIETVSLALRYKFLHLIKVGVLIVVGDEAHNRTQSQRGASRLRSLILEASLCGTMVLKAER